MCEECLELWPHGTREGVELVWTVDLDVNYIGLGRGSQKVFDLGRCVERHGG